MAAVLNVFAAWKGLVDQATTNDEKPTPGYLYNELAKKTFESSSVCESIQDYLLKRLSTDSAAVKLKTLRGNRHFKRDLTRRIDVLRDAAYPLRGDAPYRLVREEAQMVINNLFTSDAYRDEQQSISSDQYNPESSGGTPKKTMEGYQNPNIVPEKSMMESFSQKMSGVTSSITSVLPFDFSKDSSPAKAPQHSIPWSSMTNPGLPPGSDNHYSPVVLESQPHVTGKPAGTWGQMPERRPTPASAAATRAPPKTASPAAPSARAQPASAAPSAPVPVDESGDYEARIVEEATQAAGVRSVPTRDQLHSFVQKCSSLDCWLVAESLDDALASPAWQSRLKSLCLIEALLNATNSDILEYFTQYGEKLQEQLSSPQTSVRERAQRVLNFIAPPPAPEPSLSVSTSHSANNAGSIFDAGDIFNGLDQQAAEEPIEESFAALNVAPAPAPAPAKRVARRVRPNPHAAEPEPEPEPVPVVAVAPARGRAGSNRRRQSQPEEPLFDSPTPAAKPSAKPTPPPLSDIDRELLGLPPLNSPKVLATPTPAPVAMAPMAQPMGMGVPMGYPPQAYYPAPYPYAAPYAAYPMAMPPGYAMQPGYAQAPYGQPNGLAQLPQLMPPSQGSSLLSSSPQSGSGNAAGFGFVNSSANGGSKEVSFDWVKDTVKTQAAGKASS